MDSVLNRHFDLGIVKKSKESSLFGKEDDFMIAHGNEGGVEMAINEVIRN